MDAFWVVSGVLPLVLFSIAGTTNMLAFTNWAAAMLICFLRSFVCAEMAGLFHGKSGGSFVNGVAAWMRYARPFSPLLLWCNWMAPTAIIATGAVFVGAEAKVCNPWALWAGGVTAGPIISVLLFRHYVQDRGQFPPQILLA